MSEGEIEDVVHGLLVKILRVEDQGYSFFGQTVNGSSINFSLEHENELAQGDVVIIDHANNRWLKVPKSRWPAQTHVGVVRKILEDGIAVESSSGIRILNGPSQLPIEIDNTVEYNDSDGVIRIISKTPLRYGDPEADDGLQEFHIRSGDEKLSFDSFGGYSSVIQRAQELLETQLHRSEELKAIGALPVKGVIFTGPPGTGKTHLARIIASVAEAEFYLVSGPSIVSKWVGESEDTLRRLFEAASKQDRAIIFFDEIDSIASHRDGDSQGDSKRIVAQLLTLLDGFERDNNTIVIAATNRVEDIDEALLRPGRFDWEIEFPLPSLHDRHQILKVRANQLKTKKSLPLAELAQATEGWSGAMLTAIWTEAALVTAADSRTEIAAEDLAIAYHRVLSRPTRAREESRSNVD